MKCHFFFFSQHAASIYGFVRQSVSQFCQSVSSKKNLCVRSLGYIVGASPPPLDVFDTFPKPQLVTK